MKFKVGDKVMAISPHDKTRYTGVITEILTGLRSDSAAMYLLKTGDPDSRGNCRWAACYLSYYPEIDDVWKGLING